MKNESYEFIDDDHQPDVERMRESALCVKDAGPWIIDPLYGFLMDKNCEPIEFYSDTGQPTENLEFISECNPRSVCYLLDQRDTYRELCVELMQMMRNLEVSANSADYCYARNGGNFAYSLAQLKADAEKARELFIKAEKLLGGE